jgi:hypothetical protein
MVYRYVQYNGHRLTIYVSFMVKCMFAILALNPMVIVAGAALMGGHYKTDIIIGVGHLRLDSVVALVLCMVACNG